VAASPLLIALVLGLAAAPLRVPSARVQPTPPPPPEATVGTVVVVDDDPLPFRSEAIALSDALQHAAKHNLALASVALDVEISEARVLAALGAFDVMITANLTGSISETPQRGSQFAFALGQRTVGGGVGFRRALETGGSIALSFDTRRTLLAQPLDPTNPNGGRANISAFAVVPTLTLTQPLLQGAGIKVNRAQIDKAKIATTAAEAAQLATAQDLARELIGAYWELSFAHRDLENRRRSVASVRQQLDRTERMVRAGKRSRLEAKAVEQALASREADVSRAENTLLERSVALRTKMGQSLAKVDAIGVVPTTAPDVLPRPVVIDDEVDRALAVHPRIKQLELQVAGRRIDERVAANARLPKLDASASFTPQGRSVESLGNPAMGIAPRPASWGQAFRNIFNADAGRDGLLADWTLTGSVTLAWDVQNRGARGRRQEAKLAVQQAGLELEQTKQQVVADVILAANRLRTTGKTIAAARISEELARENLAAEQTKFELGRATNFDVILRLDEVDRAAAGTLRAQLDYLVALADLQAQNGEILPAYGLVP